MGNLRSHMFLREEDIDTTFSNIKDEQIWTHLKDGSHAAFVWIYDRYVEDMIRYGCQIVKERALVEDVVQDIFVSIWEKKKDQADVHSIKFYLLSATRRSLLKKLKKENSLVFEDTEGSESFKIIPSFLDEKLSKQKSEALSEKVRKVIENLTERQREIIYLKFYQNLSYQEIAAILELDQKYTYNLAARAYNNFKEKFKLFTIIMALSLIV